MARLAWLSAKESFTEEAAQEVLTLPAIHREAKRAQILPRLDSEIRELYGVGHICQCAWQSGYAQPYPC